MDNKEKFSIPECKTVVELDTILESEDSHVFNQKLNIVVDGEEQGCETPMIDTAEQSGTEKVLPTGFEEDKEEDLDACEPVIQPEFIQDVDNCGNYIYKKEDDVGRLVRKIYTKMTGFDSELESLAWGGDLGAFEQMHDYIYYESLVDDSYIGDEDMITYLESKGITYTMKAQKDDRVASIGFCPKEAKWYGWSHRAMYGFTIGDVVSEGDCTASSGYTGEYLIQHPDEDLSLPVGYTALNMECAKRMAIAFADSVG